LSFLRIFEVSDSKLKFWSDPPFLVTNHPQVGYFLKGIVSVWALSTIPIVMHIRKLF